MSGKSTGASANANGAARDRSHHDGSSDRAYTVEQKAAVIRVRKCGATAFYDILGLEEVRKEVDDAGIKKAYRKLSLLTHPDKNGYPGSDEAFKMVSRAFQILSDTDKRARYDQFGGDPDNRFSSSGASPASPFSGFGRSQGGGMRGGPMFEEEISPEELFRQFFGGGGGFGGMGGPFGGGLFDSSPGFVFNLGGGPGIRVHQFGGARPRRRPAGSTNDTNNGPPPTATDALRNLLPLLLLFLVPILSSLFSSGSSTTRIPSFHIDTPRPPMTEEHHSARLSTLYFVDPIDVTQFTRRDWEVLDDAVDRNLINSLSQQCSMERREKEAMVQGSQGWFSIDRELYARAQALPMKGCHRLNDVTRGRGYY